MDKQIIEGSEPAYPIDSNDFKQAYTGLTKRQEFAARAMQGFLSGNGLEGISVKDASRFLGIEESDWEPETHWPLFVAKKSVAHADALLEALSSNQNTKQP